ncbi:MAG: extracellular solute-binding protein [Candidatus Bathyarchaeia archaeon]
MLSENSKEKAEDDNVKDLGKLTQQLDRRSYLKYIAGAAAVIAVAGGYYYLTTRPKPAPTPPEVVTPVGATEADRAIDGVKKLIEYGKVPPDAKITILHVGGSRAQLLLLAPEWERETGIKIELATQPTEGDVFTKAIEEATTKTGKYDAVTIFSTWKGDIVEAGLAKELTDYINRYDPGLKPDSPCPPIEPLGTYTTFYKGKQYALPLDTDVFTLTYRKDLFEEHADHYKSDTGKDLKVPDTWEEVIEIAKWFTELGLKAPDGEPVYGAMFYAEPLFAAYTGWLPIFVSRGGIFFDPATMEPKINSPDGIEALNLFVDLVPWMHPEAVTGTWASLYTRYCEGKVVLTAAWPSLIKWAEDSEVTKGKSGSALLPGSWVTVAGERKLIKVSPNPVNWIGVVSNYSKYPELAYAFLQWFMSPTKGAHSISEVGIFDVFRECWFTDPLYKEYFGTAYTPEALKAFQDSIAVSFPDLMLPKAGTYIDILTKNINAACAGTKSVENALNDAARAWDEVTDDVGRESQKAAWAAEAKLYPAHVKAIWKEKGYAVE